MAILPVSGQAVSVAAGPVAPTDTYKDGLRYVGSAVRATLSGVPAAYVQGLPVDAEGSLCLVDSTGALPPGVSWQNGFPIAGALCVTGGSPSAWVNGIPMDSVGAVCI